MKYISREIEILNKLKSERVVQYINTYIDNDNILHIQMELCSNNLKNILGNKHKVFKRDKNEQMTELEYLISFNIFIELVEALNYLHEQSPPIIHRDIKPANILFTERGRKTGIFFKLCDFGLSKLHDKTNIKRIVEINEEIRPEIELNQTNDTLMSTSQTRWMGTQKYMAPEVKFSREYNTKADIYSLSIVVQQIFDLGNNLSRSDELGIYFKLIEELNEKMKGNSKDRPTCRDIIEGQNKWCLPSIHLKAFFFNDLLECQSLNFYINHHLNSIITDIKVEYNDKEYLPRYMRYENNIDKFLICDKIPQKLKKIVKYFFVFKTNSNENEENSNLCFVTNNDKVFALGGNRNGVLGLGHQDQINKVEIIPELCAKSVKDFYNSENFALCLTSDNRLYRWGGNDNSEFGNAELSYFKPSSIEYFNDKPIVQVCCGYQFSSVLTSDGRVHFWKEYKNSHEYFTPIVNQLTEEVKSIHCSRKQLFCATIRGNVYYWKNLNDEKLICLNTISNIQAICSSYEYTYFISRDSMIYVFDQEISIDTKPKTIIKNLNFKKNFQSISVYGLNSIIYNCIHELIDENCNETKYRNPFDYYCDKHNVTHKTIELNVEDDEESASITKNIIPYDNTNNTNILDSFSISNQAISDKMNIEYFHVFDKNNIIFVTVEDDVYGFGTNEFGCCGLGHNNILTKPETISELCDREIIRFYSGGEFTLASTRDHVIYAWGRISEGKNCFSKPKRLLKSICKIDNICCSRYHALFLSKKGIVYGWGDNSNFQIDNVQDQYLQTPHELKKLPIIKTIACSCKKSFAVSEDNELYIWKDDQLEFNYVIINVWDYISNICVTDSLINNVYLLIRGQIFYLESTKKSFKKIECLERIESIFSIKLDKIIAANENALIYWVTNDHTMIKTEYDTIFNYCAKKYQMTYKTINLKLQNEIHRRAFAVQGKS